MFSSAWEAWRFCTLLKPWQVWVKMKGAFEDNFAWQAQYLVNLDDVLKGRKSSL